MFEGSEFRRYLAAELIVCEVDAVEVGDGVEVGRYFSGELVVA